MIRGYSAFLIVTLISGMSAQAADPRPGLWETRVLSMTVDGKPRDALGGPGNIQLDQTLARMPPEQRAQIEARMKAARSSGDAHHICIEPHHGPYVPPVDKDGRCKPTLVSHNGDQTSYTMNCEFAGGAKMSGTGESVVTAERITTKVDSTMQGADGKAHTSHVETEMRYLGPTCDKGKP